MACVLLKLFKSYIAPRKPEYSSLPDRAGLRGEQGVAVRIRKPPFSGGNKSPGIVYYTDQNLSDEDQHFERQSMTNVEEVESTVIIRVPRQGLRRLAHITFDK